MLLIQSNLNYIMYYYNQANVFFSNECERNLNYIMYYYNPVPASC